MREFSGKLTFVGGAIHGKSPLRLFFFLVTNEQPCITPEYVCMLESPYLCRAIQQETDNNIILLTKKQKTMKRTFLLFMMTALLSVGAWAAEDLTLNASETVAFGEWGFDNSAAPTLNFSNWAAGGGWQFETALSQDDYCGVDCSLKRASTS